MTLISWTTRRFTGRRSDALINLGRIVHMTAPDAENAREQKKIIFDPIPRVEGIDPSMILCWSCVPRSIC